MNTVAFIGLGKMGLPMARHLRAAGHAVIGCDAERGRAAEARALGIGFAAAPAEAAAQAEIVFSSLPDDASLRAVARGVFAGARPGSLFVDTSTVSPAASAEVAAQAPAGVDYLRCAVSGNPVAAEAAALSVLASGPRAAFERARPLLACFGPAQAWLGEAEQARTMKLALNLMIAGTAGLMAEALALGRKGGLGWTDMLEVMESSAIASPFVKYKTPPLKRRDFAPTFTCAQMAKDLDLILEAGRAGGVPLDLAALTGEAIGELIAEGYGGSDFIELVRQVERRSGLGEPSG